MIKCENSNLLFEKLNLKEATNNTCPIDVTRDMLIKELMCGDLQAIGNEIMDDKDRLWGLFYYINKSSTSPFGFTFLGNEVSIPIVTEQPLINRKSSVRKTSSIPILTEPPLISKKTSVRKRSSRKIDNNNKPIRSPSTKQIFLSTTPKQQTRKKGLFNIFGSRNNQTRRNNRERGRWFGGTNRYNDNKNLYISLLNKEMSVPDMYQGNLYPSWGVCRNGSTSFNTLTMLKPLDRIQLYVYGSSLPIKNTYTSPMGLGSDQYCANTLYFYKFIKNISRIISLQGCGLNWNSISLPPSKQLPYLPPQCEGLEEKKIWDIMCRSNDTEYDPNNSSLLEYYWIDMAGGFFETYNDIVSLDFTDPQTTTLIHCLAGFGRTGTTLLLILSKYYFSEINGKLSRFNKEFNTSFTHPRDKRKQSSIICKNLKKLLNEYLKIDLSYGDNTIRGLDIDYIININSLIERFKVSSVTTEVFNFIHDGEISLTLLNVFITRINYIIYFTAYINKVPQVNLYGLYSRDELNKIVRYITMDNMLEFPLFFPMKIDVPYFESHVYTSTIPTTLGINPIIPQNNYTPPPQTNVVNLDEDKGDDRPSINVRPTVDLPIQEEGKFISPLAKRQQSKRQQYTPSELYDVDI